MIGSWESAEGFVVQKGSQAVTADVPSIHAYMRNLREALKGKQVLAPDGDHLRLTQDYVFNSPSTAAGVMLGRSANGRQEWQDKQGHTLKSLQEAEAKAADPALDLEKAMDDTLSKNAELYQKLA